MEVGDLGTVTRALLGLARDGLGHADDRKLAAGIVRACVAGLDVDGAALSVLTGTDARHTLWASDPMADLLEDLQFTLNEGACMQAAATGTPVLVADLHHSTETSRWPLFASAVAEQTPVRAVFALPLQWGTVNLGVLDLYRRSAGALPEAQRRDALAAADTAALMLLGRRTDPDRVIDGAVDGTAGHGVDHGANGGGWLDPSWGNRAEIHQATGMVLAQLGISATDALARLRAHAFVHRRLLINVARDVVERRLVFTPEGD